MVFARAFALLLTTPRLATALTPDADYTFERFVDDFGKDYGASTEEHAKRRAIFEDGLRDILAHNADPSKTWTRGINRFADLSRAEFGNSGRVGRNKPLAQEWAARAPQVQKPPLPLAARAESLPEAVDWRAKGVVSNVKDQGHCGSCWAFATTVNVESHAALATGLLPVLSPQQLVSCAPNPLSCGGHGGCKGSIPEVAYEYVQLFGMTTEWMYPYTSYAGDAEGQCTWNASTAKSEVSITGYQKLPPNDYDSVMDALANVGPLTINVQADGWHDYEGGVFNGCTNLSNVDIDHVVQLVGYGTDPRGGDYWLVRNSWDVTWGEAGYIRLKREASPTCGEDHTPDDGTGCSGGEKVQKVCGACGLLFDASYPLGAAIGRRGHHTIVV